MMYSTLTQPMMGNHSAAPNAPQLKQKRLSCYASRKLTPLLPILCSETRRPGGGHGGGRGLHYDLKISFCYAAPITQNSMTNIAIQMDRHLKCINSSSDLNMFYQIYPHVSQSFRNVKLAHVLHDNKEVRLSYNYCGGAVITDAVSRVSRTWSASSTSPCR